MKEIASIVSILSIGFAFSCVAFGAGPGGAKDKLPLYLASGLDIRLDSMIAICHPGARRSARRAAKNAESSDLGVTPTGISLTSCLVDNNIEGNSGSDR